MTRLPRTSVRTVVRTLVPTLVAAALLAGCGSDGTAPRNDLTSAEANVLASRIYADLVGALFGSLQGGTAARLPVTGASAAWIPLGAAARATRLGLAALRPLATPRRSSAPVTQAFTVSTACQQGGTLTGNGTVYDSTDANGTGPIAATMTVVPHQCVESTGPRTLTLDGSPDVTLRLHVPYAQNSQSGDATLGVKGAVRWTGGSCALDYVVTETLGQAGHVTGTACGKDVSQSF